MLNCIKYLLIVPFFTFVIFPDTAQTSEKENYAVDTSRFTRNELLTNLDEPMELAILPNGKILFIERKGTIKLYDQVSMELQYTDHLEVFHNLEDGLLGLAIDPDYNVNDYIYLFYSPKGENPIQRVSRFKFASDKLLKETEKVLIEIPTQRQECCHSAGSLAFGPDKTLFIAVGDNTNPHIKGYYNSIDERKGREFWDAQRTAANTNDLRGKVLRIRPEPDGTYSIPDGNLFPKDGSQGKPEVYAMGCRNPYRISVDPKTGYLYWGDVGQNTEYNPSRGPISYDEFHQAKKAGFFGWPYFAGNNEAYTDFDFERDKIGPFFDPERPVNESPNNTGTKNLPPAQPALIWYSYDESKTFEHLGTGGKTPIAGPVYYSDLYRRNPSWVKTQRKFPHYYDGKLFIAEWMRDWINVVTLDEQGNLKNIERFLPNLKFDHPIDLEFGPEGALYVLEYGTGWFAQNKNARLVRIDYNRGNRSPVARIVADKITGAAPFRVRLSALQSYDNDKGDELTYLWSEDKKNGKVKTEATPTWNFQYPGIYSISLKVTDTHGASTTVVQEFHIGNEKPEVSLSFKGNQTFYSPGKPLFYEVKVIDKEDGTLNSGGIKPEDVSVTIDEIEMGTDLTFVAQNQEKVISNYFHPGLELIKKSDCNSCHQMDASSVGPSYKKVAFRYEKNKNAVEELSAKVIKGGNGNWGQTAMSAHPQLKKEEVDEMVKYILSLSTEGEPNNQVSTKGELTPRPGANNDYLFTVTYKDRGAKGAKPQVTSRNYLIRNSTVKAISCTDYKEVTKFNNDIVVCDKPESYIVFKDIDLSGINKISLLLSSRGKGNISLHLDAPTGSTIGTMRYTSTISTQKTNDASKKDFSGKAFEMALKRTEGKHDIYVVFDPSSDDGKIEPLNIDWLKFE